MHLAISVGVFITYYVKLRVICRELTERVAWGLTITPQTIMIPVWEGDGALQDA